MEQNMNVNKEDKKNETDKIVYFNTGIGECSIINIYNNCTETGNHNDCINILFDMGKKADDIIKKIIEEKLNIHGIVVTHVDEDHIFGIKQLLKNYKNEEILKSLSFIVLNSFKESLISYFQGEELTKLIKKEYKDVLLIESYKENYDYENSKLKQKSVPIYFFSMENRKLLSNLEFKKNIVKFTFIAPNDENLKNLMNEWYKDNKKKGSGKTGNITNKSSIVCIVETGRKNILMTGDQFICEIKNDIYELREKINLNIECIKLSHHGSEESNDGIVDIIKDFNCKHVFNMELINKGAPKVNYDYSLKSEFPETVIFHNEKFEDKILSFEI